MRMSRAGRIRQIKVILMREYKRKGYAPMECGQLARRMGVKSASWIKKMVGEIIAEDNCYSIEPDYKHWAVVYRPMGQVELPPRFITINGRSHQLANWVLDLAKVS